MDPGLHRMLDEITAEGSLAYKAFADAGELRELLLNDLATLLAERFESTGRRGGGYVVPSPVTALVGRDRDVGEVVSLLAVLEASRPHWADGVAFVDLSSVTDPRLVPEAIAAALGFVGQGRERALDTL